MAVQAQFGGQMGCLADEQARALREYGALLAATNNGYRYNCAGVVSGAESELTCNGGGAVLLSRKRGREAGFEQYASSPSVALLPIPGMLTEAAAAGLMVESAMASTSGRPAASVADALVSELCQQGAEVDALVRAECERMHAGLAQARKRQCQALVRAAAGAAAARLREAEADLDAARRRAADLEERLRQAAAESQAWCGVARSNEAVAVGLRATLDRVLLRASAAIGVPAPAEGSGEADPAAADDAQSCCRVDAAPDTGAGATSPAARWACKACGGESEATVLLLPCRHLCLCKACEPRADACPVCLAAKNASIHLADI